MRELFKVSEVQNSGVDWLVASLGKSAVDGKEYALTTNQMHASEASYYLNDAKADGELIANLLNWHWSNPEAAQPRVNGKAVLTALEELFQACSGLPLTEMDRMEDAINQASSVLQTAESGLPRGKMTITRTQIKRRHKITAHGTYNSSSTECLFCGGGINIIRDNQSDVVGFDEWKSDTHRTLIVAKRYVKMFVCPHCYERLWNHATDADYSSYLRWEHFKKE